MDRPARIAALFGSYVRQQREARHWTMAELARRSGVTAQYVSFLERGQNTPSFEIVLRIAYTFGIRGTDVFRIIEDALLAEANNKG